MRTYPDAFTFSLRQQLAAISQQSTAAQKRLVQLHNEAAWRLNETEAVVCADFFAERWQSILPNYGERRCIGSDDAEYWHNWSSNTPWALHHGRPYSPSLR